MSGNAADKTMSTSDRTALDAEWDRINAELEAWADANAASIAKTFPVESSERGWWQVRAAQAAQASGTALGAWGIK